MPRSSLLSARLSARLPTRLPSLLWQTCAPAAGPLPTAQQAHRAQALHGLRSLLRSRPFSQHSSARWHGTQPTPSRPSRPSLLLAGAAGLAAAGALFAAATAAQAEPRVSTSTTKILIDAEVSALNSPSSPSIVIEVKTLDDAKEMQTDTSTIIVIDKSSWHSTFRRLLALAVHLLPVAILFPFWWFWHGRKLLQDDHKRATVAAKTATDAKTAKAGAGKTDSEDDQTRIVVVVESEPVSDSDMRLWWLHLAVSALQRCGPMYIKFGQWISSRTDILPPTVCKVFSKLQSNVTPHSFAVTRETVERDLLRGDKLETVFEWFEETPVGTGAVAQVHRAKLRNIPSLGSHAGQEVAVKVLHPNVESLIQADLGVLALVGSILSAVPGADLMSVTEEIELFGRMIERQLDLRIEAANLDRFAFNFGKSNPGVFLPVAVRPLVAARAMVETFVHGIPLRTIIERGPTVFDERVAVVGLRSFLKMVLHDNFCHADLHPGNVLVSFVRKQPSGSSFFGVSRTGNTASAYGSKHTGSTNNADPSVAPDVLPPAQLLQLASFKTVPEWRSALDALSQQGYEPRLVILDVGLVSELTPQNLDNVRECFKAGIDFDGVRLARLLTSRCKDPARVIDQKGVEAKMERMLNDVKFDSNGQLLLSRIHAVQIIQRFAAMVRQHEIGLDGDFVGLFVASIIIEGVGRTLKADLDLLEALADYL